MTGLSAFGVTAAQGATAGYQNLSSGTLGTTNEQCTSLLAGAKAPKVDKSILPGSSFYPGGTIHYQVTLNPAPTATYNMRDCIYVADSSGKFLSLLEPADPAGGPPPWIKTLVQFNTIPAGNGTITWDYVIPTTVAADNADYVPGN
ncbi:MAG TPA: hypothetical protein VGR90_09000, partial [Acidimicrobiales bacterium]|nr:hypothetical protein [Acidimicrobiales bacterium]